MHENSGIGTMYRQVPKIKVSVSGRVLEKVVSVHPTIIILHDKKMALKRSVSVIVSADTASVMGDWWSASKNPDRSTPTFQIQII